MDFRSNKTAVILLEVVIMQAIPRFLILVIKNAYYDYD